MSGFYIWGKESKGWGWQPSWYNQILDNKIIDGHSYRQQSTRLSVMGTLSPTQVGVYDGPLSKCAVIRGNQLDNNSMINLSGQSSDVVIENNTMKNSASGITIEKILKTSIDVNSQYYKDHSINSEDKKDVFGILIRKNNYFEIEKKYSGSDIKNSLILDDD